MTPIVDQALRDLSAALRGTEWDGGLWLVGGAVRDQLLGIDTSTPDIDLVLEGDAPAVAMHLWKVRAASHHPVTYPAFGTAMVHINGVQIELVTARAETYRSGSRKPVVTPGTIASDAARRDFTVNTFLQHIDTREIVDPLGMARADLAAGILRTPCDPDITFTDDPLRMLRACRFAAKLGFEVDGATCDAIVRHAHRLAPEHGISAERVRDELVKTLLAKGAEGGFELMRTTGLLRHFLPELGALYGVTQNAWHIYDVWTHTFRVLAALPKDAGIVLRLAALLHDVAKPQTRSVGADGAVHFYGHEDVGAEIARGILGRLKFDNDTIRDVCALVSLHMRYGQVTDGWSRTALRRLVRAVGAYQDDLFVLTLADAVGSGTPVRIDVDGLKARLADACAGTDVASAISPLDGGALMRLAGGRAAGPWLGAVKRYLEGLVVDGDLAPGDVLRAETLAREFLAREFR